MRHNDSNLNRPLKHASGADDLTANKHKTRPVTDFMLKCSDGVVYLEAKVPLPEVNNIAVKVGKRLVPVVVPVALSVMAFFTGVTQVHPDSSPPPQPPVEIRQ